MENSIKIVKNSRNSKITKIGENSRNSKYKNHFFLKFYISLFLS